ncbi:MAG: tRNA (adenosine(37)-N6)-threonylcarbamoyltransferase complex dimerization subunit type 1 TsaB [Candidatus Eremiobacteraeota bacterium]|nr:tRNA (adenosine(37)-N6)-threonylcarbamoyltransferase complex dimerization subunit type 1 TsaB [Candidatus Eremiobacteraeota bacterium]
MKILAIDGAFGGFRCAVRIDAKNVVHEAIEAGATLERGLDAVHRALAAARIAGHDLDRLAVCTGPGSFTGLRIAISFAKSLALGWEKPLVAIGSFDLVEFGISEVPYAAIICAREGVISVRLTLKGERLTQSGPTANVCEWIAERSADARLTTIDAPEDVLAALGERGKLVHNLESESPALVLAQLAESRESERSVHQVRPDYGDLPPARLPARSR